MTLESQHTNIEYRISKSTSFINNMSIYAIHVMTYWMSCLLLMTLSTTMPDNRFVPEKRDKYPPSAWKIISAIWISLLNQLIGLFVAIWIIPFCLTESELGWFDIIARMIFHGLIGDQWFYWTHRLMHRRWLYSKIHYIHHQWTYPMAIRTIYAHPIEHIVCNLGAIAIGPLIWPTNQLFMTLWVVVATFNAVLGHSGLNLPLTSVEKHDLHHRFLNCNYGTVGLSDYVYGTQGSVSSTVKSRPRSCYI